jgi:hypothetical protein
MSVRSESVFDPGIPFVGQNLGAARSEAAGRRAVMTKYLISFPSTGMQDIPEDDMPEVGRAARAVIQELRDAGVYVFTGGMEEDEPPVTVAADGSITGGHFPLGGMTIVNVPSHADALSWAAKIATACRCAQEVSAFQPDPLA